MFEQKKSEVAFADSSIGFKLTEESHREGVQDMRALCPKRQGSSCGA